MINSDRVDWMSVLIGKEGVIQVEESNTLAIEQSAQL
jgi:hypothetical protein